MTRHSRRTLVRTTALIPPVALLAGAEMWLASIIGDHMSAAILVLILLVILLAAAMPAVQRTYRAGRAG